jgi:hypothetical protein
MFDNLVKCRISSRSQTSADKFRIGRSGHGCFRSLIAPHVTDTGCGGTARPARLRASSVSGGSQVRHLSHHKLLLT